jgi:hypothetical protein
VRSSGGQLITGNRDSARKTKYRITNPKNAVFSDLTRPIARNMRNAALAKLGMVGVE